MSVPEPEGDAHQFWEQLYRDSNLQWSGRVNARLVDVAPTALARAAAAAAARHLTSHIEFERHDLSNSFPAGSFDLVSAQFLHSPVRLDRTRVLRNAAGAVAPGGRC